MSEQRSSQIDLIREDYAFTEPSIVLGGAVADGEVVPDAVVRLPLASMNRHGLVAGATGTGKTVTLQVPAEQLSDAGVPVFLADVKGDLTGLASPAVGGGKVDERMGALAQEWAGADYPVELMNLGGQGLGTPVRAPSPTSGRPCCRRCCGSTGRRSRASVWSSTGPAPTAWRCWTSRTCRPSSPRLTDGQVDAALGRHRPRPGDQPFHRRRRPPAALTWPPLPSALVG